MTSSPWLLLAVLSPSALGVMLIPLSCLLKGMAWYRSAAPVAARVMARPRWHDLADQRAEVGRLELFEFSAAIFGRVIPGLGDVQTKPR